MYDGVQIGESLKRKLRSGLSVSRDFTLGAYVAQRNKLTKEADKQFILDEIVIVRGDIRRKRRETKYYVRKDYVSDYVDWRKKELEALQSKLVELKNKLLTFKS